MDESEEIMSEALSFLRRPGCRPVMNSEKRTSEMAVDPREKWDGCDLWYVYTVGLVDRGCAC